MEKLSFERRHQQRPQQQQQPQQSAIYPEKASWTPSRVSQDSPRNTWQAKANAQAKLQSGKL